MRTHIHLSGNTGDTGNRPLNTRIEVFPLEFLTVGTLGTSKQQGPRAILVPAVPTDVFRSGNTFRAIQTGVSPLFPVKTSKGMNS